MVNSAVRFTPSLVTSDGALITNAANNPSERKGGGSSGGVEPPTVAPFDRKLSAKRINECIKHFNSFANAVSVGILGAAAIIPFVKDRAAMLDGELTQWCAIGALFHILPYVTLFLFMQSEE